MRPWARLAFAALLAGLSLACSRSAFSPSTADGGTIYREACAPCHEGSGDHDLKGLDLAPKTVERRLRWGGRGMPAFPHIRGEARENLVGYVTRMSRSRE